MFRYGFELEAFKYADGPRGFEIPPAEWPTDGFPGLIEIRTNGHWKLDNAYYNLFHEMRKYKICAGDLALIPFGVFTPEERRRLRKERHWGAKKNDDIKNIYGKKPRALNNKTIASLQINISWLLKKAFTDEHGKYHSDEFGLFDAGVVVKKLDKEFASVIKCAGRQPGEYCIKGPRLEYRSLPNNVINLHWGYDSISYFLNRIEKCVS